MIEKLAARCYNQALGLAREAQFKEALVVLKRAVSYDWQSYRAWCLAGLCYYRLGSFAMAGFCFEQGAGAAEEGNLSTLYLTSLKEGYLMLKPHFDRAEELCRKKRHREAALIYRSEIISKTGPAAALFLKEGILWQLGGRPARAIFCFEEALKTDPGCLSAKAYLAELKTKPFLRLLLIREKLISLVGGRF